MSQNESPSTPSGPWLLLEYLLAILILLLRSFAPSALATVTAADPATTARDPAGRTLHVVGLLGTTDIPDDWWIATDFLVWRELLSHAGHSTWLSGVDLDYSMGVVLGDPFADRLKFPPASEGITVAPTLFKLATKFSDALQDVVKRAKPEDIVVIVLCSHGTRSGAIRLGGGRFPPFPLEKSDVESALKGIMVPQERLFLLSTACYSGSWRSPSWTLLAAAEEDHESVAMRASASDECRGGFYTYAVLAQMADEQGLEVPACEKKQGPFTVRDLNDIQYDTRHPPTPGNLSTGSSFLQLPPHSLTDLYTFIHRFRDRVGGIYRPTDLVVDPASDGPSHFPIFQESFLKRLHIIGPSPPTPTHDWQNSPTSDLSDYDFTAPLALPEIDTLMVMAQKFLDAGHPTTASTVSVVVNCSKLLSGKTLPHVVQRGLLSRLQCHARACRRATAIADSLGWAPKDPVEKWRSHGSLMRMKEAESAGAKIISIFCSESADAAQVGIKQVWRPLGPGEWLGDAWHQAGRPEVHAAKWAEAVLCGEASARALLP